MCICHKWRRGWYIVFRDPPPPFKKSRPATDWEGESMQLISLFGPDCNSSTREVVVMISTLTAQSTRRGTSDKRDKTFGVIINAINRPFNSSTHITQRRTGKGRKISLYDFNYPHTCPLKAVMITATEGSAVMAIVGWRYASLLPFRTPWWLN